MACTWQHDVSLVIWSHYLLGAMKHHLTTASDLQKEPGGMGCWVHLWPPVMKLGEDRPAHDALHGDP